MRRFTNNTKVLSWTLAAVALLLAIAITTLALITQQRNASSLAQEAKLQHELSQAKADRAKLAQQYGNLATEDQGLQQGLAALDRQLAGLGVTPVFTPSTVTPTPQSAPRTSTSPAGQPRSSLTGSGGVRTTTPPTTAARPSPASTPSVPRSTSPTTRPPSTTTSSTVATVVVGPNGQICTVIGGIKVGC